MALCAGGGEHTGPDAELCVACGSYSSDALPLGAPVTLALAGIGAPACTTRSHSPRSYSSAPADDYDGTDPFWRQEPDPRQFRFGSPGLGQLPPGPTAAERDREFRYEQTVRSERTIGQVSGAASARAPSPPPSDGLALLVSLASPSQSPPLLPAPSTSLGLSPPGLPPRPASPPLSRTGLRPLPAVGLREPASGCARTTRARRGPAHQARSWHPIVAAALAAALLIAAAIVVVLVRHHDAARHPQTGAAQRPAPASLTTGDATTDGLVTVEPHAGASPDVAAVAAVLNRYFSAIDRHAYRAYKRLFSPAARGGLSAATFLSGYGTTRDSAATLHSVRVIGAGQIEAVVTFTSHQQSASSPTQSRCTAWQVSLHLVKRGGRYLLDGPPGGRQPSYRRCA